MAIRSVGPTSTHPTIAAALLVAIAGDTIQLEAGYSNETATITQAGVIISGDAGSTGIVLQLATGIATFTTSGTAPFQILDAADANGIVGNAGDNLIRVSSGIDSVDGGLGIDRLVVDYRLATGAVTGNSTSDFTEAGGGGRSVTITAGTIEHFTVLSGAAADTITTGAGDDIINVGSGANTVTAGDGNNSITGGDDADTITSGAGNDTIIAGGGTNTVTAGQGANSIIGGSGADTFTALDGGNYMDGGEGTNNLTSGAGSDTIISGAGASTIVAGGGQDIITVLGGASTVSAGAGDDSLVLNYSAMTTNVTGGITGGNLNAGYVGNFADQVAATMDFTGVENFTILTGSGNDAVTTGDGTDYLRGGAGNDSLTAGGGDDQLFGGAGADVLNGGAGFDYARYDLSAAAVFVRLDTGQVFGGEAVGDSFLSIEGLVGSSLADTLIGSNFLGDVLLGQGGDDTLYGQGGNDALYGGNGNDQIYGGLGADLLFGGAAYDVFWTQSGEMQAGVWDTVMDFGESGLNFDYLRFQGITQASLTLYNLGADCVITSSTVGFSGGIIVNNFSTAQIADQLIFG